MGKNRFADESDQAYFLSRFPRLIRYRFVIVPLHAKSLSTSLDSIEMPTKLYGSPPSQALFSHASAVVPHAYGPP